jgi:GNAT superfamily N-acetyltransferase
MRSGRAKRTRRSPYDGEMTHLQISPIAIEDIEALVSLVDSYRSFYGQQPSIDTRQYLTKRIEEGSALGFIARVEGHPAGFTLIYPTFSTVALAPIWLLNDLYVDENHRRQGIADALLESAENEARQAGAARIWLRTAVDNAPARALYENRGWVLDDIFCRYDLVLKTP